MLAQNAHHLFGLAGFREGREIPEIGEDHHDLAAVAAEESLLRIPSFTLLDLRAGIESDQGRWRVEIWGRNVTNRFYVTGATRNSDFTTRFTGMPATFGISLRYRFGQ